MKLREWLLFLRIVLLFEKEGIVEVNLLRFSESKKIQLDDAPYCGNRAEDTAHQSLDLECTELGKS